MAKEPIAGFRTNDENRNENDFYPTPPIAVDVLIHALGDKVPDEIWEPCAGTGWISKALEIHGRKVISTDLNQYENTLVDVESGIDFFDSKPRANAIITNPPYHKDLPMLMAKRSIEIVDFTAFFVRLPYIEGVRRYHTLFKDNPPFIIVPVRRIDFTGSHLRKDLYDWEVKDQLGGISSYIWVVWGKDIEGGKIVWVDQMDIPTTSPIPNPDKNYVI